MRIKFHPQPSKTSGDSNSDTVKDSHELRFYHRATLQLPSKSEKKLTTKVPSNTTTSHSESCVVDRSINTDFDAILRRKAPTFRRTIPAILERRPKIEKPSLVVVVDCCCQIFSSHQHRYEVCDLAVEHRVVTSLPDDIQDHSKVSEDMEKGLFITPTDWAKITGPFHFQMAAKLPSLDRGISFLMAEYADLVEKDPSRVLIHLKSSSGLSNLGGGISKILFITSTGKNSLKTS